jgi:hypothetical protein
MAAAMLLLWLASILARPVESRPLESLTFLNAPRAIGTRKPRRLVTALVVSPDDLPIPAVRSDNPEPPKSD